MTDVYLAFEHRVLKPLKSEMLSGARVLIACSAGLDSTVLASVLAKWRRRLKWRLTLAHVHHGHGGAVEQNHYRDSALAVARTLAGHLELPFLTNQPESQELSSEAELRRYRLQWLKRWKQDEGFDYVAFAHHRDDLLETRILRLLRGTGAQGLQAMRLVSPGRLRPLLSVSRSEIEAYGRGKRLDWLEDPTNKADLNLRNWLRNHWLPQLDRRQPGMTKSLSRSLALLAETQTQTQLAPFVGLRRAALERMSAEGKKAVVALYLKSLLKTGYSETHVMEMIKRLDTRRKNFEFEMLGTRFRVTHDLLWCYDEE